MRFVAWFDDISRHDTPLVGGKGANLGEMRRAALPVPPGFVVTVDAFREFTKESGLDREIEERLKGLVVDEPTQLHAVSEELQRKIRRSPMPESIRREIEGAYPKLGSAEDESTEPLVAVRSSATVEDAEQASFAGMFRSHLNIRGSDELLRAIQDCWASGLGARVLFYRMKRGMASAERLIAVVVQRMVQSEQSGVVFTLDPSTGDREALVVESTWGLGETVVGGQVVPDRYVVRKSDLKVVERHVAQKAFELILDPQTGKNVRRELPPERSRAPSLSDEQVRELARLGLQAETHYGSPQDLEFAFEGGKLYLVQTRPVTTGASLAPPPAEKKSGEILVRGFGASPGMATGRSRVLRSPEEGNTLEPGEILFAPMTTPDWVPFMRRAAAIVTDSGGSTSHAAIVSR